MSSILYSYFKDSFLTRTTARVRRTDRVDGRPAVVLDDTIFYPEGGGQPADHGSIDTLPVVDVQKRGGEIFHVLKGDAVPAWEPGRAVELELDWRRRFDHMQQHSGQHLLTAVADRLFGWQTTSFHLGAEVSDIELDVAEISAEQMATLEDEVAGLIRQDLTVIARFVGPEALDDPEVRTRGLPEGHQGPIRIIEINGVDQCACGGTHLRTTCELEGLKLLSTESIRGGTRLFWIAGSRLRHRLEAHEERNRRLREVLQTGDEELVDVARLKLEQQKDAKKRLERLEKRWAEATAEALAGRPGPWVEAHFEDTSAAAVGLIARQVTSRRPDLAVFLTAEDGKGAPFVIAAGGESEVDVPSVGKRVAPILDGRGGGKGPFFQGKAGHLDGRPQAVAALSETLSET